MDSNKQYQEQIALLKEIQDMQKNSISDNLKIENAKRKQNDAVRDLYSIERELSKEIATGNSMSKKKIESLQALSKLAQKDLKLSKEILSVETKRVNLLGVMSKTYGGIVNSGFFKFLMETDKAVRDVTRELGMSGDQAARMRTELQGAATGAARLGGNIQDLANIQSTFADETGRARVLSEETQLSIMKIGLGTGLGIENAAKLAGQFELMGLNAQASADYVQGVVDVSERMGVNTTKVLKNISANFKDLQKFTFRNGVKGFAEMAMHAEKFKFDMGSMLDSAERARTLEGAVDLAAQLQVMGGEFAKSDPFELLFLSRNDPDKYAQKINNMTKGVATFKKNADGTFQTFISPMDLDRLNKVGDALGMQKGELAEQSRRMKEISATRQGMLGMDLSKDLRDAVEAQARLNTNTGKMEVMIGGAAKNITQLTKEDAKYLQTQASTLQKRAEDAKNFDKVFSDTILELKSALLPVLDGFNTVIDFIKPIISGTLNMVGGLSDTFKTALKVAGGIGASALLISGAFKLISPFLSILKGGGLKNITSGLGGGSKGIASTVTGGASGVAKGGGFMKSLAGGAGVGVAAAGIGTGVMLAAKGFAQLATAMKDLNVDQLETFKSVALGLAIAIPVAAVAIGVLATAATLAAKPLLALGGAVALIGAGVGVASFGIGEMAKGLSTLDGVDLSGIGSGMLSIGGAALMIGNPMGLIGMVGMSAAVSSIGSNADNLERVGNAFYNIGAVMKGSSEDFKQIRQTIDAINTMESGGGSAFSSLAAILSKPLKVEFSDNNATFNATVNLNIDGKKIADSINVSRRVSINTADQKSGKSGSGSV